MKYFLLLVCLFGQVLSQRTASNTQSADTSSITSTSSTTTSRSSIVITASNTQDNSRQVALPTFKITAASSSTTATIAYPTPIIPDTSNNPFLKESTAPEGTVFIAVGAVIGGLALAVLAWRGLVAYLLHKSIQASTVASYGVEGKTGTASGRSNGGFFSKFHNRQAGSGSIGPFYTAPVGSSVSLDQLTSSGRIATAVRPTSMYDDLALPASGPSFNTSSFYSPTAGAMGMSAATNTPSHLTGVGPARNSTYMPTGYYGLNNGATSSTSLGQQRIGTLPANQRSSSPASYPRPISSLNVPPQPGQRVPSQYLDGFLDDDRE
ncbi:hypothetical protein V1512DRAFT_218352 [Lipomyces arxii]|uniref:uncharacterized protein n=1 Tax=Lipomyces arxii TaxID=56418 RepID=UPI0034D01D3A